MSTNYETGHAKNLAHFQTLITFCEGYGAAYNPVKDTLSIAAMQAMLTEATDRFNEVKNKKTAFDNATNARRTVFADLRPLATRVVNAFAVSGADPLAVEDARGINRKLQGSSLKKETPETPETTNPISTSQQSYDKQIDHFLNLIEVLEQAPAYKPNEVELQPKNLRTLLQSLNDANTAHIQAYTPYSNALIARDKVLYEDADNICSVVKESKAYIKSVFGATSPQYKQVSGLEFTKPR
ncbi:hypothetical protein [Epilithonimonas hungarica]|uniref:Uncharacterized protein n=1 Tax=Epilithonimonas hungarica TaxID=454006 RepID=A0A1G7TMR4_9FLAO|nr:hypothetical protein [Epilithonimonas hungarica]SDG36627.1 hypothetical protein SAMN05421825_3168 [Epilithonimonas hungarica]